MVVWCALQAYEGNPVDVDMVIEVLTTTDLSPAALAAAEAAALGLIFKPPPKRGTPGQGKVLWSDRCKQQNHSGWKGLRLVFPACMSGGQLCTASP